MSDKKCVKYTGILSVIVILLLVIIGEVFYFSNKDVFTKGESKVVENKNTVDNKNDVKNKNNVKNNDSVQEKINITMITDKRCGEKCNVDPIVSQLKQIPTLSNVDIKILDYSDEGAKELLEKSEIKKLPAALFSSNKVSELAQYLKITPNNNYSLALGATFDPTAKMSDKGFLVLDKKVLEDIKSKSYLKGDKNAKITLIEYSDLECPFCAKLHNSGTPEELEKKYGNKLNKIFQSFPLGFHKNALPGAEALECLGKEKGGEAYYKLMDISFKNKKSELSFLIDEAVKLGANKESLTKCIEAKTFSDKINAQQKTGADNFGITGTPGNVLINNETGEYSVISGAYPTSSFVEIIDRLLK